MRARLKAMVKRDSLKSKKSKLPHFWGPGPEFPYLGITVPKHRNWDISGLSEDREVNEGSFELH